MDFTTNIYIDSITSTQAYLHTYYYYFKQPVGGGTAINDWFPLDTNQIDMAYTLYSFDSLRTMPLQDFACDPLNPLLNIDSPAKKAIALHLYPNPATNELFINMDQSGQYTLQIFDLHGSLQLNEL